MSSNQPHSSNLFNLSAKELLSKLQSGEKPMLLDVREPIEFHTFNIGGINIPLLQLKESVSSLNLNKNEEIIVMCKVGLRSATAQSILQEMGYTRVKNLEGGLLAVRKIK